MVAMMLPGPIKRVNGEPEVVISARTGKPKRKKALRACNHCQKSHLTCDNGRPCQRCVLRGLGATCRDGVRKKAKYLDDSLPECCSAQNGGPSKCRIHSKSSLVCSDDSGPENTVSSDGGSAAPELSSEGSHLSYSGLNIGKLSSRASSTGSFGTSNQQHSYNNPMLTGPSKSSSVNRQQSISMSMNIPDPMELSNTINPDHIHHQNRHRHHHNHHSHPSHHPQSHHQIQPAHIQQHSLQYHSNMSGHDRTNNSLGFSPPPSQSTQMMSKFNEPLSPSNSQFGLHSVPLPADSFNVPSSLLTAGNSEVSSRDTSVNPTGTANTPSGGSLDSTVAPLSSTPGSATTAVRTGNSTAITLKTSKSTSKSASVGLSLSTSSSAAAANNAREPNLSTTHKQEFQSLATNQEYAVLSNILHSGRNTNGSGTGGSASMYSPGMSSVDGDSMMPLPSSRRDYSLGLRSLSSTLIDPSINMSNPLDRDFLTLSQNGNKNFFVDAGFDDLDSNNNHNSGGIGGSGNDDSPSSIFSTTGLPDWASHEVNKRKPISFTVSADTDESGPVFREPDDIYSSVKKPFSHTPGFHGLLSYLRSRFDKPKLMTVAKCMADYRPSFIACTNKLKEADLIFMEQCFQRTLLEYEKFISLSGTPTIIWRRSGQIAAVGKEFCMLTGWTRNSLLDNTKFIVELMDDDSVVEYFQIFSKIAFGDSRGASMSGCTLLTPSGKKLKTSCIWTLRRDVFGIPMMVIGNFLPILF